VTATRHCHTPDGTFRKILPPDQVRRELADEDVFASGRCTALLADCINAADRDHAHLPVVRALVSQVCDSLLAAAQATGTTGRLDQCFLWYLLGLGGWLVPAYHPAVYQHTLRNPVPSSIKTGGSPSSAGRRPAPGPRRVRPGPGSPASWSTSRPRSGRRSR
jgi:hypothetical protein